MKAAEAHLVASEKEHHCSLTMKGQPTHANGSVFERAAEAHLIAPLRRIVA
jgi:hypothetical protein